MLKLLKLLLDYLKNPQAMLNRLKNIIKKRENVIKINELNPHNFPTTPEIDGNLPILLERVNKIRAEWGKVMTVTSGLRSMEDHLKIYAAKGITDLSKIPMKSKHLIGAAVDISDPDLEITAWLKENDSQRLIDAELWCEEGNANWVHFQIYSPASGNRWFKP